MTVCVTLWTSARGTHGIPDGEKNSAAIFDQRAIF